MVKARKRAPGGGRKPQGPFRGNTAVLGLRMQPDLREDLEREAKRNRTSLSQEIQRRLKASLAGFGRKRLAAVYGFTTEAAARNSALGELIGRLAARIESSAEASWRHDRYAYDALVAGINLLLAQPELIPAPDSVSTEKAPPKRLVWGRLADRPEKPADLAAVTTLGLLQQMKTAQRPPIAHPTNTHYADEFYVLPKIRQALDLNGGEK